ncbi:interferon gamma receptor 2 [Salminus brasiliensis]|uniref:interferon gamma receptor 2 n=1 Tax=Salminus brasiliensis TaxID=930266 RepID=UPI003B82EF89
MDWRNAFVSCLVVFTASSAWSIEPPTHVKVELSVLSWKPPPGETNVTYTVQYSMAEEEEWHNVCGCNQPQFNFTAEDFYGKIFRVRAETANQTSVWKLSKQVQCEHTGTCAPLFNLTIKTNKALLWMGHKDQTLYEEFGGHITFRVLYWKEARVSDNQERNTGGMTLAIEGLEFGQKYCFQVVYLVYSKSFGNPSHVLCKVIPLSSAQENFHIIISGVVIVVGLVIFGVCLYFVYKNYKKVKLFLQPPLDIPEHIERFLSEEFPHQERVCLDSQELELNDLVILEGSRGDDAQSGRFT